MIKILQKYLRFWSRVFLKRVEPEIVAISGSVGKTSAKEAVSQVLRKKFGAGVRKSEGNLNNETGVPLAILGYRKSPKNIFDWFKILFSSPFRALKKENLKVLILEMAADKPGDINYLVSFARPKIAVLTGIGPAHIAAFGELEKIIDEKTDLLRALPADGWAILNIDDRYLKKVSYGGRWQTKTYSTGERADFMAKAITTKVDQFKAKTTFQLQIQAKNYQVQLATLGTTANVLAALAAVGVGQTYEIAIPDIIDALGEIESQSHRMNILQGKNGTVIIDDCYNANPLSMKAGLDVLRVLPKPLALGRKIAILGDMLELGKIESEAHQIIGEYARKVASQVISIGKVSRRYKADKHFSRPEEAIPYLLANIQENDIILIKASRAIGLERVVEALKK